MKSSSDSSETYRTSIASTKADLRELRANSGATVLELREFLKELKGRPPQEMLGIVASSQLFRALILSTTLVAVTIFALTAVPYFLDDAPTPATEETTVATPAATPPALPADPTPATDKPTPDQTPATLGIDEKITAPPNSNPLEDKKEDFLKDLE